MRCEKIGDGVVLSRRRFIKGEKNGCLVFFL